jgi:hypothetical protein
MCQDHENRDKNKPRLRIGVESGGARRLKECRMRSTGPHTAICCSLKLNHRAPVLSISKQENGEERERRLREFSLLEATCESLRSHS